MLDYLEKQYGDRALNGNVNELESLQRRILEVEAKLELKKTRKAKESESSSEDDRGSEHETDNDVSFWFTNLLTRVARSLTTTWKTCHNRWPTNTRVLEHRYRLRLLAHGTRR